MGLAQISRRWLEISQLSGQVNIQRQGNRNARVGDRLDTPGQGVTTGNRSSAILTVDNSIGTVAVAANTQLTVQQMNTLANGAQVTILNVPRGQARVRVRQFTSPDSRLELHTPSGVAAVRGTEFGVSVTDTGQTAIGTLEGTVDASAQGQTVQLEAGFAATIRPGEPPTAPQPLDRQLSLELVDQYRRGRGIYVQGKINPTNRLLIAGKDVAVKPSGYFAVRTVLPRGNRTVILTVENPLGESRDYPIRGWQLDDLDRGS